MTRDDILNLKPGRDLDCLVAKHVMRWVRGNQARGEYAWKVFKDGHWEMVTQSLDWSTDNRKFMELIEGVLKLGFHPLLEHQHDDSGWRVEIGCGEIVGEDLKEMVCKAALMAMMGVM